ncbi:MAG: flagellar biosynthesis protein FlhB [bacterium]|nr:flagellar biosynthesis protein FlhB [bacterium]
MATDKGEKTEDPTERRKQDAEKKGDIPRSKDLAATMGLFSTIIFFSLFMPVFAKTAVQFWKQYFSRAAEIEINQASLVYLGKDSFATFLKLVVPLFLLLVVVAVLVEIVQAGGLKIIPENLRIKWDKVNFLAKIPEGLKKVIMSVEALTELIKSILKVIVIGAIAFFTLRPEITGLLELPHTSVVNIMMVMGRIFLKLSFYIVLFMIVLSVLDYLWQRHRYIDKLKMSKQDVKDEHKQAEGDPKVKGRQKRIQYQWAMRRMMAEVPEADVVITNPSHYAVALKYDFQKMKSPKLLAKGKELIAQKIKEVAKKNNVPIVENPPVARAVYTSVEVNDYIPSELFKPIAEILAYIYKLKGKKVG